VVVVGATEQGRPWSLESTTVTHSQGRRMVTAEKLGIDDKTLARWLADELASH
jgi:hypothetical protein